MMNTNAYIAELDARIESIHNPDQLTLFPSALEEAMALTSYELAQLRDSDPKLFEVYKFIRYTVRERAAVLKRQQKRVSQ